MNILLLGSGGREHAFAWKLSQSPDFGQLFTAPGNAGTAQFGTNLPIAATDFDALKEVVLREEIGLVICGPEDPLVRGAQDFFQNDPALADVGFVGPSQEAAQLEGSKAYAKAFMADLDIPTAGYQQFTADTLDAGLAYLDQQPLPIVLKADGLAAGKGVLILHDREEAKTELKAMLDGKFGAASTQVVVEAFLDGIEFSVFVVTDGVDYQVLPVAKDYKRIGEGDTGPNTGGMGSVSHPPFVDAAMMQKVESRVIQPTIAGLQAKKLDYRGFIFIGLISVKGEPYVIEYNCRMGDPETQSVFARLDSDLLDVCQRIAQGGLGKLELKTDPRQVATVVLVSGGYPGSYEKGKVISGLDQVKDSLVFHAGVKEADGQFLTNGGRVLAVTSYGETFEAALALSNANAAKVQFEGVNYRRDIGFDL
ncbi:MAG: phosphoribosylamine--glycine ligase [Bacteroidota bacterium]